MLSPGLRAKIIYETKVYEGEIPYMYLDSKGLVTVGVGFYMASPEEATKYKFNISTGGGASASDIMQEYDTVSRMEPNRIASFYKQPNSLVMPEADIDTVLSGKIDSFNSELIGLYSGFDDFPGKAKQALFDMVFNLGITNLRNSWPSFNAAINEKNWMVAAEQSHRKAPVSGARNDYVKNLFLDVGSSNKS